MNRYHWTLMASAALSLSLWMTAQAATLPATANAPLDLNLPQQYEPFSPPAHASSAQSATRGTPVTIPQGAGASDNLNDTKPVVWGSLAAGVGYSKAFGTTNWEGANVNVTKLFGSVEHPVRVDVGITVSRMHNLGNGRYPYPYPYPW